MNDYIDKVEVGAKIQMMYIRREMDYGGENDFCRGMRKALRIIENTPSADVQPVDRWISVDDKLPEWDKTVLVWYASDTLFGVSEGYGLSWYHGSWRLNDLNGENIRIFYWQYLPEKPKDGDTECQ